MKYIKPHSLSIYISYVTVCPSVTATPAATVGPRTLIFGMDIGLDGRLLIFFKSRSKVKGHGQKSGKMCLFESFLATEGQLGSGWDRVGSCWVPLAACQIFLAQCQKS